MSPRRSSPRSRSSREYRARHRRCPPRSRAASIARVGGVEPRLHLLADAVDRLEAARTARMRAHQRRHSARAAPDRRTARTLTVPSPGRSALSSSFLSTQTELESILAGLRRPRAAPALLARAFTELLWRRPRISPADGPRPRRRSRSSPRARRSAICRRCARGKNAHRRRAPASTESSAAADARASPPRMRAATWARRTWSARSRTAHAPARRHGEACAAGSRAG